MIFSLSECIIWVSLFTAEFVAIVTVNLLSIILFIKNRSLRTRSMHLVISLTVADMLVGALSGGVSRLLGILQDCRVVKFYLAQWENDILYLVLLLFFPLVSLTNIAVISLERFHATFRPFRHRLIKRWVYVVAIAVVWVLSIITLVIVGGDRIFSDDKPPALLVGIILLFVFNCYLCFLHVHSV